MSFSVYAVFCSARYDCARCVSASEHMNEYHTRSSRCSPSGAIIPRAHERFAWCLGLLRSLCGWWWWWWARDGGGATAYDSSSSSTSPVIFINRYVVGDWWYWSKSSERKHVARIKTQPVCACVCACVLCCVYEEYDSVCLLETLSTRMKSER